MLQAVKTDGEKGTRSGVNRGVQRFDNFLQRKDKNRCSPLVFSRKRVRICVVEEKRQGVQTESGKGTMDEKTTKERRQEP
jgi:hypothetical protein